MGLFDIFKRWRSVSWARYDEYHGGDESSSGACVTVETALGVPAVFACVRVLAESIAALPLITYERLENDDKRRARDFSLYPILHDIPNPLMTASELWEMMAGHLALRGNAYAYIERDAGEVVALWPLHPDRMKIELKNRLLVYSYQNDETEVNYRAADILHIRGLSSDGIIGYSPLQLCRDTFGSAIAVREFSSRYFKNDASPGGILTTPNALSQTQTEAIREGWNKGFQGSKKAHKTAVLGGDLKWQAVGISPEDSQMIDTMKFSVVEIARIFRVPLNLVMDYERSTYSNVTEQNRSFLTHTLRPWLTRIEQAVYKALLTEEEKKRYFAEYLTADLLRGDTKSRYEAYEIGKRAGFLTVNEIRTAENLNRIEGGDSLSTNQS
ncbi:phage portal protein [uncultured Desulfosarcina sp.]|uniref:phage portal protein n=1 Tax=uncultured Desulfosarcina sp. TaxID=218289 RepID=UPI0029C8B4F0|nr:phage portal protein [uncultured Desulfosarcina sp.]